MRTLQLLSEASLDIHSPDSVSAIAPPVVLRGLGDAPVVRGEVMPRLTWAQFHVVNALIEAGDVGLTKDQLDVQSNHSDARKILKRLHDSDPRWAKVIQMPGIPGRRYRIA